MWHGAQIGVESDFHVFCTNRSCSAESLPVFLGHLFVSYSFANCRQPFSQVDNLQQRQPPLSSGAIMLLYLAFSVAVLDSCLPRVVLSITREYYIAAMVREWNYAPTGLNLIKGVPLNDSR